MPYNFAVSQQAEEAIYDAGQWYEQQKKGLGEDFLIAVDDAFLSIKSNPLLYGFRKKNIRGYRMRRFPYKILFLVNKEEILVISVLHTSRKPNI